KYRPDTELTYSNIERINPASGRRNDLPGAAALAVNHIKDEAQHHIFSLTHPVGCFGLLIES
ncbi:hypothetical protein, partial [Salmonella enterica]|uniref:hypothetical protein n=1 Tax=Salmonella enterica TaxID=28901 RepID=UPI003CE84BE9